MKNTTVVLIDPANREGSEIRWDEIGTVVTGLAELYQNVKERQIDLILVDVSAAVLRQSVAMKIRRYNGLTEIWTLTQDESAASAQEDHIDGTISMGLGMEGLADKIALIYELKELLQNYGMVGRSARMKAVARTIQRIAPSEVPVLIEGPSGSGKELAAHAVHKNSHRRDKPFVAINCAAIAEGILESELFGHEKGAFTGSVGKREGLFHKAEGGTIFLDEIGETKPDTQVKLLRVLEDGTYYPVGSSTARKANVRLVSATNIDLGEAIREKLFREDLYFRIGVVKVVMPSILERLGDVQPLLQYFWAGQTGLDYTDSAMDLLLRYDWPGNVRQLRNFADRMVALKSTGTVEVEDVERFFAEQSSGATQLPVATGKTVEEAGQELIYHSILQLGNEIRLLRDLITSHLPSEGSSVEIDGGTPFAVSEEVTVENMERKLIRQVLAELNGNRKATARKLGIGERTLYRKLKKYDLE